MLRGIVSASKFANQRLAASSSSSSPFSPPSAPVLGLCANKRVDVQNDAGVRVTNLLGNGRTKAMDGDKIMAPVESVIVREKGAGVISIGPS